jgi:hypothetical protein
MTIRTLVLMLLLPTGAFAQDGVPPTLPDPPPLLAGNALSAADPAMQAVWAKAVAGVQTSRAALADAQQTAVENMATIEARLRDIQAKKDQEQQAQQASPAPTPQQSEEQPEVQP